MRSSAASASVSFGSRRLRRARISVSSSSSGDADAFAGLVIACIERLLFVAKGVDRPKRRRAVGGIDAEEETDADADAERERDREPFEHRLDTDDLEVTADETCRDARYAADDGQQHGLGQELSENVA